MATVATDSWLAEASHRLIARARPGRCIISGLRRVEEIHVAGEAVLVEHHGHRRLCPAVDRVIPSVRAPECRLADGAHGWACDDGRARRAKQIGDADFPPPEDRIA